jgi:hypothetical protein
MPHPGIEATARSYIQAVGSHDLEALEHLLDDDLRATFAGAALGKAGWTTALRRLLPVLVRNEIREVFTSGDRACVVYDFVTGTAAGAVRCVELLTVNAGRVREIELILDRVGFAPVNRALNERTPPMQ